MCVSVCVCKNVVHCIQYVYYVTRSNCLEVMSLFRLESHRAQLWVVMGLWLILWKPNELYLNNKGAASKRFCTA